MFTNLAIPLYRNLEPEHEVGILDPILVDDHPFPNKQLLFGGPHFQTYPIWLVVYLPF